MKILLWLLSARKGLIIKIEYMNLYFVELYEAAIYIKQASKIKVSYFTH